MATTNTRVISCVTSKSRTSVCGLMGKALRISPLFYAERGRKTKRRLRELKDINEIKEINEIKDWLSLKSLISLIPLISFPHRSSLFVFCQSCSFLVLFCNQGLLVKNFFKTFAFG